MKNRQWVLVVKGRRSSLFRSHGIVFGIINNSKKIVGKQLLNYPVLMKDMKTSVYLDRNELKDFSIYITNKLKKDPNFARKHFSTFTRLSNKLFQACNRIPREFKYIDNAKMSVLLSSLSQAYENIASYMTTPHLFQAVLENKVKEILVKNKLKEEKIMILAIPSSETFETTYQKDLMKAAVKGIKGRKVIKKLREKWEWISMDDYPYESLKDADLVNLINMNSKTDSKGKFKKMKENQMKIYSQAQELLHKMVLTQEEKKIIGTLQKYIWLRTARLETFRKFFFYSKPLILEIGRRAGLNGNEIFCMTPPEIREFLRKGQVPSRDLLQKRTEGYVMSLIDGEYALYSGKEWVEKYEVMMGLRTSEAIDIVKGRAACLGKARGKVKIIFSKEEISKVKNGDILVTTMTSPDYVIAMRKAAAIVTDEGGITCHAAIISRELNVPCIVGTGNATEVLKDGDLVEVDAHKGLVIKLFQ